MKHFLNILRTCFYFIFKLKPIFKLDFVEWTITEYILQLGSLKIEKIKVNF